MKKYVVLRNQLVIRSFPRTLWRFRHEWKWIITNPNFISDFSLIMKVIGSESWGDTNVNIVVISDNLTFLMSWYVTSEIGYDGRIGSRNFTNDVFVWRHKRENPRDKWQRHVANIMILRFVASEIGYAVRIGFRDFKVLISRRRISWELNSEIITIRRIFWKSLFVLVRQVRFDLSSSFSHTLILNSTRLSQNIFCLCNFCCRHSNDYGYFQLTDRLIIAIVIGVFTMTQFLIEIMRYLDPR